MVIADSKRANPPAVVSPPITPIVEGVVSAISGIQLLEQPVRVAAIGITEIWGWAIWIGGIIISGGDAVPKGQDNQILGTVILGYERKIGQVLSLNRAGNCEEDRQDDQRRK